METSIASLDGFRKPDSYPPASRIAPVELTEYRENAVLRQYKIEEDGDVHLVLKDDAGRSMIAEIPNPGCVGSTSPFADAIASARSAFGAQYIATTTWRFVSRPVQVTGVGFFDVLHGQTGVAPNGVELHPVLGIVFP